MLLIRMLMMCLALVSVSMTPVNAVHAFDDDPVCFPCSGIAEALATQQAAYDDIDAHIQSLHDELGEVQALLAEILASNLPQSDKTAAIQAAQGAIDALEGLIELHEAELAEISASIHALWDSWFALGCDNL